MPGEKDLEKLLRTLKPKHIIGDYVFCVVNDLGIVPVQDIILLFREEEGYTIIIPKELADELRLDYTFISSWITLTVHSSLEAVGLTASFSKALAAEGVSCNVVAAYFHDHIFVDHKDREKAMAILNGLSS